jgi:hypothetical protein
MALWGFAFAEEPHSTANKRHWVVARHWDGGSCEASVVLLENGGGCGVGADSESFLRDGKMEVFDAMGTTNVGCGEAFEACGIGATCECRIEAGNASLSSKKAKSASRDGGVPATGRAHQRASEFLADAGGVQPEDRCLFDVSVRRSPSAERLTQAA